VNAIRDILQQAGCKATIVDTKNGIATYRVSGTMTSSFGINSNYTTKDCTCTEEEMYPDEERTFLQ